MTVEQEHIGSVAMGDSREYSPAMKRIFAKLAEEGGGTWATYMMIEIDEATAALSRPVQEPLAWTVGSSGCETHIDIASIRPRRPGLIIHIYPDGRRVEVR